MKQVRKCVLETNSSSTHSLCICTQEEYDKWKNGEMIYDYYNDKIVPIPYDISKFRYRTYDKYCQNYDLESYEKFFTTPNGDRMVAFGEYGFNG